MAAPAKPSTTIPIKITSKRYDRLTPNEKVGISRLTLRSTGSAMRNDVLSRDDHLNEVQVFIARYDGHIIAWAVALPGHRSKEFHTVQEGMYNVYCYVRSESRRMGIGASLIRRVSMWASRYNRTPRVFKWSEESDGFYDKQKQHYKMYTYRVK